MTLTTLERLEALSQLARTVAECILDGEDDGEGEAFYGDDNEETFRSLVWQARDTLDRLGIGYPKHDQID